MLKKLWCDVRLAASALARTPAFVRLAVLNLTLGFRANTSATVLRYGAEPARVRNEMVTASYLLPLGVRPSLGRGLLAPENSTRACIPSRTSALGFGCAPSDQTRRLTLGASLLKGRPLAVDGACPAASAGARTVPRHLGRVLHGAAHFADALLLRVGRLRHGVDVERICSS